MDGRKMHQCADYRKQSLMSSLNNFVEAVNTMDKQVMIPSRLRDMDITSALQKCPEENNNMSVVPLSSVQIPGEELYNHFVMINAVKREVLSGKGRVSGSGSSSLTSSDCDMDALSDDSSDDGVNTTAKRTADAFSYHLQGLFGLLHQMTETAQQLGDVYEDQIGTGKKAKKFVI